MFYGQDREKLTFFHNLLFCPSVVDTGTEKSTNNELYKQRGNSVPNTPFA
jgi:hypothetical protein